MHNKNQRVVGRDEAHRLNMSFRAAYQGHPPDLTVVQPFKVPESGPMDWQGPVVLNGVPQWVMIRTQNIRNPVLLILHGGPGLSLIPFHHRHGQLEQYFTIIHWDQRGAGGSFCPGIPLETMTLDQIQADAQSLVRLLQTAFGQPRLFLAGHSLGSAMGLCLVAEHPTWFHAFVGLGQVIHKLEAERRSCAFLYEQAQCHGDQDTLRFLAQLGDPPYTHRKMVHQRALVRRYGGNLYGAKTIWPLAQWGLSSPHVSWPHGLQYLRGLQFSIQHLWEQAYDLDLFTQVPSVQVPVFFLAGRHDYVVPSSLVAEYVDHVTAPHGKTLIWFEQSAHWPHLEEPAHFMNIMTEHVLPLSGNA